MNEWMDGCMDDSTRQREREAGKGNDDTSTYSNECAAATTTTGKRFCTRIQGAHEKLR